MARIFDRLRLWWQIRTGEEETPFDGDMQAWGLSMIVHLMLLVGLTLWNLSKYTPEFVLELSTAPVEEIEELEQQLKIEDVAWTETDSDEIGANSIGGAAEAMAEAPIEAEISEVPVEEIRTDVGVGIQVDLNDAPLAVGPNVGLTAVRGAQGVGTTGAGGAIDRLTQEILQSLEQRKTLVVWLFDKSGSLQRQRTEINARFDRVYRELGVIEESGASSYAKYKDVEKPLLTSVMAFGQQIDFLTPKPTDNLDEIKAAVASIKNDPSGIENVFEAVTKGANANLAYRTQDDRRNVMLIVFSDEIGDDQNQGLDPTVKLCRKYQMPVYVVGVPAPFGQREVEVKYIDPDPEFNQAPQWIPVMQGPESFLPEVVRIRFTSSRDREEPIDSGFGPYSLTRLCYETGGIYFAVHPNRTASGDGVPKQDTAELSAHIAHFFLPEKMRKYRPDYVPAAEYLHLVKSNRARGSLVEAAAMAAVTPMASPNLDFPKVSEAELANALTAAQRDAAKLEPELQKIYDVLATGESDRAKIREPRWRAGYDLALGRAAAVLCRTKGYNAMLAKAKQGMKFADEKNDTWVLKPDDEISVGSALEKVGQKATFYLKRVVAEHEGTPWAMLASRELEEPMGWKWTETFRDVHAPPPADGTGNATNPGNDTRRMLEKPKPVRVPKL